MPHGKESTSSNGSVVFWFFHDFADHSLLAVKIVVVEVLVHVLEYLDPLEDVDSFPWGIVVGSILSILPIILTILILSVIVVSVVAVATMSRISAPQKSTSIDKIPNYSQ